MEITAQEAARLTAESLPKIEERNFRISLRRIMLEISHKSENGFYECEIRNNYLFEVGVIPHLESLGYYIDIDSKNTSSYTKICWGEGIPKKKKWYNFITKWFKK